MGHVPFGNDCDDTTTDIYPGALEACNDIAWSIIDLCIPVTGTLLFEVRIFVPIALPNFGVVIEILMFTLSETSCQYFSASRLPWCKPRILSRITSPGASTTYP